jgi:hypothetical protein
VLAALVIASAAWRLPYWRDCLHDDAFISMRYARHLAAGTGLTFNPGERVEGYTNFLWTVLLAAAMRLGADPVRLTPWLSLAPALLLIVLVYLCGRRYGNVPHPGWALVAPFLVAAHPFLLAESVGGLETTLFVLLVFAGFERQVAAVAGEARAGSSAAAFALATLVRPEGALCFVVALAGRELSTRGAEWRTRLRHDIATYLLLVAPLIAFRREYYGDWVPNTFHAKVGWNWAQVSRGVRYLREWGGAMAPLPVLLLALAGLRGGGWRLTAALIAGTYTLYVLAVGGDFAPTGRFVLLPIPFVALLVQSAVVRFATRPPGRRAQVAVALAAALLAGAWSTAAERRWLRVRQWPQSYRRDLAARQYLGRYLGSMLPQGATIAVGSIGAIGYESDRPLLDTFGLTNVEIGRKHVEWMGHTSAGHEKGDADVVLRRAPEVIVFDRAFLSPRALEPDDFLAAARSPTEHLLVEDPRLFEMYALRRVATPVGVLHFLERVH